MQQLYGPQHVVHGTQGEIGQVVMVEVALDKHGEVVEAQSVNCRLIVALPAQHSEVRRASYSAFQSCMNLMLKL